MAQRCSFFAQLMVVLAGALGCGSASAAPDLQQVAAPTYDKISTNAVEAVDVRDLKRGPRVLEDMFQDELNELSAMLAPEASNDDISRFEPPPPTTTFRRVWKSKGALRSNGSGCDSERALARSKAHNPDLVVPYIGDASSANSNAIRVGFDDQILGFDGLTCATSKGQERLENTELSALQTAALLHATESAGEQVPSFGPAREGATAPNFSKCPMGHQWRIAVMRFGTNYYYDEQFYQTITGLIAHKLIDTSRLKIEQGPHVRTTTNGRTYALEGLSSYDVVAYNPSWQEGLGTSGLPSPSAAAASASTATSAATSTAAAAQLSTPGAEPSLSQELISGLTADPYAASVAQGLENRRIGIVGTEQPPQEPVMIAADNYKLWHPENDFTHRSDYYMPLFRNFADPAGYAYYVELTQDSCFSLRADAYYSSEWDIDLHEWQIQEVYERSVKGEIDMVLVFGLYDISRFDQRHFDIPIIVVGHDQDILYNNFTQSLSAAGQVSAAARHRARANEQDSSAAQASAFEAEFDRALDSALAAAQVSAAAAGTAGGKANGTAASATPSTGAALGAGTTASAAPGAGATAVAAATDDFVTISGGDALLVQSEEQRASQGDLGQDTPQEILRELGPKADATLGIVTDTAFSLGEFSPYRNIFVHLDPIKQYDDLVNFYHMMGFTKLGVIVDNSHTFRQLHSVEEIRSALAPFNVRTEICTGELISKDKAKARSEFDRCTATLIASGVDAVYLTRTSALSLDLLYSQLWPFTSRGIAVFSRGSTSEVKAGALMSYSYGYAESFRHYQAQVISSVMNGRSINTLSQYFYPRQILTVNAKIASMIGWYPPYKDLSKIDITYLDIASN